jgi:hypothetical protein
MNTIIYILIFFSSFSFLSAAPQVIWSTIFGGNGWDALCCLKVNESENVFITGFTYSPNFPVNAGAFDTLVSKRDIFVTKFDSSASGLIFSTFIGGSKNDQGSCIALDNNENLFITGVTASYDFPTTPDVFNSKSPGDDQVFITKLNSKGDSLLFSTYIGEGTGFGIAIDTIGNSYISGYTSAEWPTFKNTYPVTSGAFDTIYGGDTLAPCGDGFITKLNSIGSELIYSTYIGGNALDNGWDVKVDNNNNAYVNGITVSSDFPTTAGAYDTVMKLGDAFITKINSIGSSLIYSTFIGGIIGFGSLNNESYYVQFALDNNGCTYLTGGTQSNKFPLTPGAFDTTSYSINDGVINFITKLNPTGNSLIYSTIIGHSAIHTVSESYDISIDSNNNAYITGQGGINYPMTKDALFKKRDIYGGGFLTELNSSGSNLIYSSFLNYSGGIGYNIALDKKNNIYVGGHVTGNFPTTKGAFQRTRQGNWDMFLMKFGGCNGAPEIQTISNLAFKSIICDSSIIDSFYVFNPGSCVLALQDFVFTGSDSSEFSIISPPYLPVFVSQGDTEKIVVQFSPSNNPGTRNAALNILNNSKSDTLKKINIKAQKFSVISIDNSNADKIIIDLGTLCPGEEVDTTILIKNLLPVGTRIFIQDVKAPFHIQASDKTKKVKVLHPLSATPIKKKKTK